MSVSCWEGIVIVGQTGSYLFVHYLFDPLLEVNPICLQLGRQ